MPTVLQEGGHWISSIYEFNIKESEEIGEWDELVEVDYDMRTTPSRAHQTNCEIFKICHENQIGNEEKQSPISKVELNKDEGEKYVPTRHVKPHKKFV